MKCEIKLPPQPKPEAIVLTLTPREAVMLKSIIGLTAGLLASDMYQGMVGVPEYSNKLTTCGGSLQLRTGISEKDFDWK